LQLHQNANRAAFSGLNGYFYPIGNRNISESVIVEFDAADAEYKSAKWEMDTIAKKIRNGGHFQIQQETAMAISNEQLAAAIKAAEDAAKLVTELKEQSRAEDLKAVKELIALHGFLQKDLTPELKTRGTAKKAIAPKKTAGRSKAK
jgi:hypothetical protein